jgi:hypothetical protein
MGAAMIGGQRGEDLLPIVVFVGQQPDLAALLAAQRIGAATACAPAERSEVAQARAPPTPVAARERTAARRPGRLRQSWSGAGARRLCRGGNGELANPTALRVVCRRRQQRSQPIEHFFRQLPTAEGVPDTAVPPDG